MGNRKRKTLTNVGVAAIVLFCLFGLAGCKGEKPPPPPPPPKVTVTQPLQRKVTYYLELTGNTQGINTVQLVARVAGYLDKVFFYDGQFVRKGQLLFLIQQNTYIDSLQQAEGQVLMQKAQLQYAQSQFIRYSKLLPENAASQSDVDNWRYQRDSAEANLKAAVANEELARLNLSYTEVRAPFNGRVDRRLQDPGNLVGSTPSNTALTQIIQIDPIYVYFTISDVDLARLIKSHNGIPGIGKAGWPVSMGLTGEEDYPHNGHLDFAATSISTSTGTLNIRGIFPNKDGRIIPGLYARMHVPLETRIAMLVPSTAVGSDQQGNYVLNVNSQNIVERRNVKAGPLEGKMRVIEEGLKGNERVIVSALLKAHPGKPVVPEPENAETAGNR
jgi:RND family efflux transporter MFP subunit